MNITITKDLKRKTHTPSGTKGKTLCGKRIASSVPVTTDRPGCKVCAVVYDQALRGVMRSINDKSLKEKDKNFAQGFVFFAVEYLENFGEDNTGRIKQIFDEAGYKIEDFNSIEKDERTKAALYRIFTY